MLCCHEMKKKMRHVGCNAATLSSSPLLFSKLSEECCEKQNTIIITHNLILESNLYQYNKKFFLVCLKTMSTSLLGKRDRSSQTSQEFRDQFKKTFEKEKMTNPQLTLSAYSNLKGQLYATARRWLMEFKQVNTLERIFYSTEAHQHMYVH